MAEADRGGNETQGIQKKLYDAEQKIISLEMEIVNMERINKEIVAKLSEANKGKKMATERENKLSQNLKPKLQ